MIQQSKKRKSFQFWVTFLADRNKKFSILFYNVLICDSLIFEVRGKVFQNEFSYCKVGCLKRIAKSERNYRRFLAFA